MNNPSVVHAVGSFARIQPYPFVSVNYDKIIYIIHSLQIRIERWEWCFS